MKKRKILIYLLVLAVSIVLIFLGVIVLEKFPDSDFTVFFILFAYSLFFGCIIYPIVKAVRAIHNKIVFGKDAPREMSYSSVRRPEDVRRSETFVYNKKETFRFEKSAEGYGWGLLTFFLMVIYPAGLYLAVTKTVNEKTNYRSNGVMMGLIGGVFTAISVLLLVFFVVEEYRLGGSFESAKILVVPMGVVVAASLVVLIIGCFFARKGGIFDRYMDLITVRRITKIDKIAAQMQTSPGKAVKIIEKLINEGLLGNAYIYYTDNEVLVPGISKKTAVKCTNCGGTTILYANEEKICSYCGGKI